MMYTHILADAMTAIMAGVAGKILGWNWLESVMGIVGAILYTRLLELRV
ncbi:hypothetical protein TDB9533_03426 [Thalassocella blandensis]|nr:hypothetical protein TDB9533_03426 [Thalassocella blandensis]